MFVEGGVLLRGGGVIIIVSAPFSIYFLMILTI